jgi:hypothetical protein
MSGISMTEVPTKTGIQVNNTPWSTDTNSMHQFNCAGRYVGSVKVKESALQLFDQAMKETLDQVMVKETKSCAAIIQN